MLRSSEEGVVDDVHYAGDVDIARAKTLRWPRGQTVHQGSLECPRGTARHHQGDRSANNGSLFDQDSAFVDDFAKGPMGNAVRPKDSLMTSAAER